jgi:lipid A 4'-phosphatase
MDMPRWNRIDSLQLFYFRRKLVRFNWHCAPGCLSLFVLSAVIFINFPQIDLWVSSLFYGGQGHFPANDLGWVKAIYHFTPWMGRSIFFISICILLVATLKPQKISRKYWRRAASLAAIIVLGIGLLIHVILKDGMGRPRPRDVQMFAGPTSFVPLFKPSQFCSTNCSFVSGHAAVGFSLMSLGMLGARRRRQFWWVTGLIAGSSIGMVRVAQGGHFLSDVVFSFLAIWACHLLIRAIWIRFKLWQLHKAFTIPQI